MGSKKKTTKTVATPAYEIGRLSVADATYLKTLNLHDDILTFYASTAPKTDFSVGDVRLLSMKSMRAEHAKEPGATLRVLACTVLATTSAGGIYFVTRGLEDRESYDILLAAADEIDGELTRRELRAACDAGPVFHSVDAFLTALAAGELPAARKKKAVAKKATAKKATAKKAAPSAPGLWQVTFPNPYGGKKPTAAEVAKLQKAHGFSAEYAAFLRAHGGFSFAKLEADKKSRDGYLTAVDSSKGKSGADLARLDDWKELSESIGRLKLFARHFFPVGSSYGGDAYVEILQGKHKGAIASLNHENYLGMKTIEEFVEESDGFFEDTFEVEWDEASVAKQTTMLTHNDLDLVQIHAPSWTEFLASCIHCDERFVGKVRDLPRKKKA